MLVRIGQCAATARLIELAATGRLDIASMVCRRIGLDGVNDGLAAIERGEVIRSVIVN
jgi:S-(hydroxymethyl)glutathione dehydrogenase/alcohol dehydrogenase